MRKIVCFLLVLAGAAACKKHGAPPESSFQLNVTIDPFYGSVSRLGVTDTFVVLLRNPSVCPATPVVLHIPAGARCNVGGRVDDSTWKDTVDISFNKTGLVTVTAANGNSGTYGIVYNYVFSQRMVGVMGVVFPRGLCFAGDTLYIPTSAGLYMSTDSGSHFTTLPAFGLGDSSVYGVYVQDGIIYAATFGGLSISGDGGQHFANHPLGGYAVYSIYVQGDTVYAGTYGGVYVSRDKGAHFTGSFAGLGSPATLGIYAQGSSVYAATTNGLSISADGGVSYTNHTNGLGSLGGQSQCNGLAIQGGTIYAATVAGLSVSLDGGAGFMTYASSVGLGSNWANAVNVQGGIIWVGTNGGLSYSADGGAHFASFTAEIGLGDDFVFGSAVRGTTIYAATAAGLVVLKSRL
jgi:hypothetical protein